MCVYDICIWPYNCQVSKISNFTKFLYQTACDICSEFDLNYVVNKQAEGMFPYGVSYVT
jgi:hypothetical protein